MHDEQIVPLITETIGLREAQIGLSDQPNSI